MRKIFLFLSAILFMCSVAFANIVNDGGIAYTPVTKTDSSTSGVETDTDVWTPASGNKIVLMGVQFSSAANTTLLVEQSSTAVIPTTEYIASGILVIGNGTPIWKGAADEALTYTTSESSRHSILMWGYETSN